MPLFAAKLPFWTFVILGLLSHLPDQSAGQESIIVPFAS
jgi:hypothetical protein